MAGDSAIAKHLDDRLMAFAVMGVAPTACGGLMVAVTGLPARTAVRSAAPGGAPPAG